MDRSERAAGAASTDILANVLATHQTGIWTALPGIVQAFRKAGDTGMVVDVQIAVQMQLRNPDQQGTVQWINIPLVLDCPVLFPGGGGFTLTFPIVPGDECLVMFASRCINAWFQNGGVQQQEELRMHDLSDGFALVGVRSKPHTLNPQVSATATELRNDAGTTKISIEATKVKVTASAEIALTAPLVTINAATTHLTGDLNVDGAGNFGGNVTAPDVTLTTGPNAPVNLSTHRHHIAGAGDTDPPKP